MLDIYQVLDKLREIGITDSIQTVRRWLRTGELKGELPEGELRKGPKKKAGYQVHPKDLETFIQKKREENWLYPEVKRLEKEVDRLKKEVQRLTTELEKTKKNGHSNETATTPEQDQEQERDESDAQPSPIQGTNTISPIEIRIFWNKITRGKQDPETETYLRMESVQKAFNNTILSNNTVQGNQYICPITKKVFTDKDKMMISVLTQIIEEKRKAHLQWAKENC